MIRITVILLLAVTGPLVLGSSILAQAPDTVWSRTYLSNSAALSLHELPDSGFVLGGYITPEGATYRDMFIARTDANGDTLWTGNIGQPDRHESASDLYPASDGGFILAGNRGENEPYSSYSDLYLVKADANGAFEWHSIFGSDLESETGVSVVQAADSGYLIAGYYWDALTGYDIWLLKTDYLGLLQWPDHITWSDADYPTCINLTSDLGFAITGYTQSFDSDYDYDMFILKLNEAGVESWSLPYGSSPPWDEVARHICPTSDGGYLLCGYRSDDTSPKDIYVVKTDQFGAVDWTSQLGGAYHDEGRCCIETVDGGFAVSASWHYNGSWKTALIKYNADGDTLWTSFWGDSTKSYTPYGLVQTADNGYAVGGLVSGDTSAAFLVKFAAEPAFDPYTFHSSGLNTPVDESTPASDTISVFIEDKYLAGRAVLGARISIDTLNHPALEELTFTLAHDGVEVILAAEGDASGANFYGTVFSDASIIPIGAGQAPYSGTYRPNEVLSAFSNRSPNGNWVLTVSDGALGNDGVLGAWGFTLLTDLSLDIENETDEGLPAGYELSQCYPNPFNPATIISYSLPRKSDVTLEIFNIAGRKVATLVAETKPAGEYQIAWNGTNSAGKKVATGVYLYRLQAGDFVETRKMVLMK